MQFFYKIKKIIIIFIILFPAIFSLMYIFMFGSNSIYWDQWYLVDFIGKIYNDENLKFIDFFLPHFQHIIFFPRLLMLLLAFLTKYNIFAELLVIFVILLLIAIIFLYYFKEKYDFNKYWYLFVPIPYFIFNLRQSENLLWGWQISFLLPLLFGILSFFLIDKLKTCINSTFQINVYFTIAIFSATIATFSSAQGMIIWVSGLIQILISKYLKYKLKNIHLTIWSIFGIFNILLYLFLLEYLENPIYGGINFVSIFNNFKDLYKIFNKFILIVANSLFNVEKLNNIIIFILVFFLFSSVVFFIILLIKQNKLSNNGFLISLLTFSIFTIVFIAIGRSWFSSSRYISYSIYIFISTYLIIVEILIYKKNRLIKYLFVIFFIIFLINLPLSIKEGILYGKENKYIKKYNSFLLYTYKTQPPDALLFANNFGGEIAIKNSPLLEKLGYNVFSKKLYNDDFSNMKESNNIFLYKIEDTSFRYYLDDNIQYDNFIVEKNNKTFITPYNEEAFLKISGWAVDKKALKTASAAYLEFDGKTYPVFYGIERKDIENKFNNKQYRYSGFLRYLPLKEIGKGKHDIYLLIVSSDKKEYQREIICTVYLLGSDLVKDIDFKNLIEDNSRYVINIDEYSPRQTISGIKDITGWIIDDKNLDYSILTVLIVNGQNLKDNNIIGIAEYYIVRNDVVKFFKKEQYLFSGFNFKLDTTKLKNGNHKICIYAINKEGIYTKKCYEYIIDN